MVVGFMASWPQLVSDFIPPPDIRKPLSPQTFIEDLLPPIICYYATAVLVLIPNTLIVRLAFLPVTLWSIFRASTTVDVVKSFDDVRLIHWNQGFVLVFTTMAMRVLAWSVQFEPYERAPRNPSEKSTDGRIAWWKPLQLVCDAFDLSLSLRGHEWDWSAGLQLPIDTRPTSPFQFGLYALASGAYHLVLFDVMQAMIQSFSPTTFGTAHGTIFDASIPLISRYLQSSTITLFAGFAVYSAMQAVYDFLAVVGLLSGHVPNQWPRLFDSPWKSTSISEFWSKRWHQLFRHQFISVGGKPMYYLLGRVGAVMGVFFMSAVFHHFGLWGMGRGTDFSAVGGYFLIQGVGTVLEGLWKRLTGSKVQGMAGWIWTMIQFMVASTKGLDCLPVELLYEIQLYAASENFPLVSKWFQRLYANSTASFRAEYLLERLRSAHGSDLLSKALRYPLCTEPVLEALCFRMRLKGDKRSALSSAPQLPRRLFRGLQPRTLPNDNWRDRDPPLPFLRYLYSTKSFPPPDPNSHEGYALTKAVHTRFHTLAQLLLDNGASPKLKKGLAVFVAIRMNDIKMVKMLVERDGRKAVIVDDAHVDSGAPNAQQANLSDGKVGAVADGNGNSVGERGGHKVMKLAPGKKRRLEDRIEVTPEMLKVAVRCQAKEVVDYLTKEKGCVPDMQTLLMMTQ